MQVEFAVFNHLHVININKNGASTLPCGGTPVFTFKSKDVTPS